MEYIEQLPELLKRGLIAAALERAPGRKTPAVSSDLKMTHEAIIEVMREEQEAANGG